MIYPLCFFEIATENCAFRDGSSKFTYDKNGDSPVRYYEEPDGVLMGSSTHLALIHPILDMPFIENGNFW